MEPAPISIMNHASMVDTRVLHNGIVADKQAATTINSRVEVIAPHCI